MRNVAFELGHDDMIETETFIIVVVVQQLF